MLKCACGQKEVVQLGDVSRVFERHADGQKVIVVNLRYLVEGSSVTPMDRKL